MYIYIYIYINSRTSLITVIANKIMTIHRKKIIVSNTLLNKTGTKQNCPCNPQSQNKNQTLKLINKTKTILFIY
jgi:hypothetical protein